jgi:pimeloyl-ACP methyl ester carboxylesterase
VKHIYCISGFGADERLFSNFFLPGYEIHFVKWITPEKNESINSYAKKLIAQINHPNPILIGVSFGGIMCIEIAREIQTALIIIISSIKSTAEMPFWMQVSGKLKLNRLFPMRSYKILQPIQNYNLGVITNEEKGLVNNYRKNLNLEYSNWAVNAILNWKNNTAPKNLFHIHGTKDRIFSINKIKPDHTIQNGGHLMILNRSSEINECINNILIAHKREL